MMKLRSEGIVQNICMRVLAVFAVCTLLMVAEVYCEAPPIEWELTFDSGEYDFCYGVDNTSDGGSVIVIWEVDFYPGPPTGDIRMIKFSSTGEIDFDVKVGPSGSLKPKAVCQTADGGFAVAAIKWNDSSDEMEVYLAKTDNEGIVEFDTTFASSNLTYPDYVPDCIQPTADGGYIISGDNAPRGLLIKTDSLGNLTWEKFPDFGGEVNYCSWVEQTSDLGYIVGGATENFGFWDAVLYKTYSNGNEQWHQYFVGKEYGWCVDTTGDGGYILVSSVDGGIWAGSETYLTKTNGNGAFQWERHLDIAALSVVETSDQGFLLGVADFFVIKTDSAGESEWEMSLGDGGSYPFRVVQTNDGGYVGGGYIRDGSNYDAYVVKLASPYAVTAVPEELFSLYK